jgi:hypothetical protein
LRIAVHGLGYIRQGPVRDSTSWFHVAAQEQFIVVAVPEIPTVFLQEGAGRMDKNGEAAADAVEGFRSKRN